MAERDFMQFIAQVKNKTGIDLSLYKEAQMKRRLTSLRNKRGYDDFSSYLKAIAADQELYDELLDRITINVSEFFRNYSRWEILMKKILPRLLREKPRLKIWSAACSTGEEPYSLAMGLTQLTSLRNVDILATDIDRGALERAKEGIYPERSLAECPKPLRAKYFEQREQLYHVSNEIKQAVRFRRHNLLADSFETGFDLIVCRNVMIYFTEEAKHTLYEKFSQALRPGGVFFVGSTEQIFQPKRYLFEPEDTFFYRKLPE
ncbi:chemotaxis protein CheR [Ammoniphilus oxalaticus]|uniref:protein-glutamate O-methyltransferase n=1 Tax=Ammoniphilus oxalaticus TaxID=66863 RepID=A0A419SN50_9BACL|nr:protein-glutamate O-methyltransferase CheR [Ammoniphilus oxalaticus]RKD25705.1 chemotaxis protein CheR [Ammoniphilus oxalaticus]